MLKNTDTLQRASHSVAKAQQVSAETGEERVCHHTGVWGGHLITLTVTSTVDPRLSELIRTGLHSDNWICESASPDSRDLDLILFCSFTCVALAFSDFTMAICKSYMLRSTRTAKEQAILMQLFQLMPIPRVKLLVRIIQAAG